MNLAEFLDHHITVLDLICLVIAFLIVFGVIFYSVKKNLISTETEIWAVTLSPVLMALVLAVMMAPVYWAVLILIGFGWRALDRQ
jgi:uncharacterized membrane protein affecting hemolysin expression